MHFKATFPAGICSLRRLLQKHRFRIFLLDHFGDLQHRTAKRRRNLIISSLPMLCIVKGPTVGDNSFQTDRMRLFPGHSLSIFHVFQLVPPQALREKVSHLRLGSLGSHGRAISLQTQGFLLLQKRLQRLLEKSQLWK